MTGQLLGPPSGIENGFLKWFPATGNYDSCPYGSHRPSTQPTPELATVSSTCACSSCSGGVHDPAAPFRSADHFYPLLITRDNDPVICLEKALFLNWKHFVFKPVFHPIQWSQLPRTAHDMAGAQPSIASNSSIMPEIMLSPLSQNFGSEASSPKGASNSLWCFEPPAFSISKYLSWKPASPSS